MCWQALRRRDGIGRGDGHATPGWWPDLPADVVGTVLLQNVESLYSTSFCSFGEPMLHPGFGAMMAAALDVYGKRGRLRVDLTTNGSLLKANIEPLVRMPGTITVSIDSPDRETYGKIRRGLNLDWIATSLAEATGHPAKHHGRTFNINMTVGKYNVGQIVAMSDFAVSHGVGALAIILGQSMDRTDAVGQAVDPADPEARALIAEVRRKYPSLIVTDYFTTPIRETEPCPYPWHCYDVAPDGQATHAAGPTTPTSVHGTPACGMVR
jgi:MoaA/NifB/PqqE/SkfB family radical SAM enzyme